MFLHTKEQHEQTTLKVFVPKGYMNRQLLTDLKA